MQVITQINGTNPSSNAHVARSLEQHHVIVTHEHLEEFMIAPLQDVWERHEMMVDLLQAVARSSFHTVINDKGLVTRDMAVQVLQAMLSDRPVIFSELPDFADDVDTYTQRLIASRLHIFGITNISRLDSNQVRSVLRHLHDGNVDYALSLHDTVLIRSKIRNYLRELLSSPQISLIPEAFLA